MNLEKRPVQKRPACQIKPQIQNLEWLMSSFVSCSGLAQFSFAPFCDRGNAEEGCLKKPKNCESQDLPIPTLSRVMVTSCRIPRF
jgi:hypothetical protein